MAEITYQIVLSTLQTAGLLVGIFYYIMTLRNQQKSQKATLDTRQVQLHIKLYETMLSAKALENGWDMLFNWEFNNFDEFWEKYGVDTNREAFFQWVALGNYYENVGILISEGLIDVQRVEDMMSFDVIRFWERFEQVIIGVRETLQWPSFNEWVEYLYNQLGPIYYQEHPELKP